VAATPSPLSGTQPTPVSAAVTGLTPGTLYYFRVVASGPGGTVAAPLRAFVTASGVGHRPPPTPQPGVALVGSTLVITGSPGDDVVRVTRQGGSLRVYASFLPPGVPFLAFRLSAVKDVRMALGDGDDVATVAGDIVLPVLIDGGAGDDVLGGGGSDLL